jgi:hypothetical protein
VPYALQVNYSPGEGHSHHPQNEARQTRQLPFNPVFHTIKPGRADTIEQWSQDKKMRAGQEGKTMRAKSWTVVVASVSHLFFRLPSPIDFASRPSRFIHAADARDRLSGCRKWLQNLVIFRTGNNPASLLENTNRQPSGVS